MIARRRFVGAAAALVAAASLDAAAQAPKAAPRVRRVGVLVQTPLGSSPTLAGLDAGLREVGHPVGRTVVLEARSSNGNARELPRLAAELVALDVAVVVAVGPAAVGAALGVTRTVPIVAIDLETDPVAAGWAASLAHPGGNLTGLFLDHPAVAGKWLDLLREAAPAVRKVGVLWDKTTGSTQIDAAKAAAPRFAVELDLIGVHDADELRGELDAARHPALQALMMLSSPVIFASSARIADYTMRRRIPGISPFRPYPEAGGLMSYGPDLPYFFRRSALYVDKLLKGARANELPIEQPTRFGFVINLAAAKALGLTLPQSMLQRADDVIQ
jgi:putative ABC transport system substrate-binding protein